MWARLMATQMPSRICKGDKVRLKEDVARKYGHYPEDVFVVHTVEKVCGRPRIYCEYIGKPERGVELLWANDCQLAWGKSSAERRKALGL